MDIQALMQQAPPQPQLPGQVFAPATPGPVFAPAAPAPQAQTPGDAPVAPVQQPVSSPGSVPIPVAPSPPAVPASPAVAAPQQAPQAGGAPVQPGASDPMTMAVQMATQMVAGMLPMLMAQQQGQVAAPAAPAAPQVPTMQPQIVVPPVAQPQPQAQGQLDLNGILNNPQAAADPGWLQRLAQAESAARQQASAILVQ